MPLICSPLRMMLPLASPLQSRSRHKQAGDLGSSVPWLALLHLGDAVAAGAAPGERESGLECLRPRCNAVAPRGAVSRRPPIQSSGEFPNPHAWTRAEPNASVLHVIMYNASAFVFSALAYTRSWRLRASTVTRRVNAAGLVPHGEPRPLATCEMRPVAIHEPRRRRMGTLKNDRQ